MDHQYEVSNQFDHIARNYDEQRRRLIPCFDDFYTISVALATSDCVGKSPRILDLGAGTGLLSSMLIEKYPDAELTLIDLSGKMLEVAKARLAHTNRVNYIQADYTDYAADDQFDIIISALSIHHLTDEGKAKLYRNSYRNLKRGGVFINADQVLGSTPFIDSLYKKDWKSRVESSDLSQSDIQSAYDRTALDKMTELNTQLNWLQESGFADVDCIYKFYNFVVLFGRKL